MIERSVKEFSDAGPILDEMRSPYHGVNLRKQPEVYLMRARRAGPLPRRTLQERPSTAVRALRMSAKELAGAVCGRFLDHKAEGDFVGMDVARKYLQMDYTRARHCARYRGGNKKKPLEVPDLEKSRAAEIFY